MIRTTGIALALVLGAAGMATAQTREAYELPDAIAFPEGVALDAAGGLIYTAGAADGRLVAIDARTGESRILGALPTPPEGLFPAALGMSLDGHGRLWVSGGRTGRMFVVDAKSGQLLKQFQIPADGSLINDVAIAGDAAYFTDTLKPTLWKVSFTPHDIGELEPWIDFTGSPLQYATGPNLNGIAATPDGRTLLTVQMNTGHLFRIDIADRKVTKVDLGDAPLNGADGLVLDGRTLYVVRQTENEVATVKLSDDLSGGEVVSRFKDPSLMWPATAALNDGRLLVVNSQFNRRAQNEQQTPFRIIAVPTERLAAK